MHSIVVVKRLAAQLGQQAGACDSNFIPCMSWLVEKVDYCFQQVAPLPAIASPVEMLNFVSVLWCSAY